jgi:exonuclease III
VREAESGYCCKSSEFPAKFRAATWNLGSLKKRSAGVVEILTRVVDLCAIQEHRWTGSLTANQTHLIKGKDSTYKLFWCANDKGQGGVRILLDEKWFDKVFDVQRISDRVTQIRFVLGRVFTLLSIYALHVGLSMLQKKNSTIYSKMQWPRFLHLSYSCRFETGMGMWVL